MPIKKIEHIADLIPDPQNANRGTVRGAELLETSLAAYGAGRGVVVDKHGVIIAGNKTVEHAQAMGLDIVPIHTDGSQLVVTVRDDLDVLTDPKAKGMALADNRVGQVNLAFDSDVLAALAEEIDMSPLWNENELAQMLGEGEENQLDEHWREMPEFQQEKVGWKSLTVHFKSQEDYDAFAQLIEQTLTEKTKFIWFPHQERENLLAYKT